MRVFLTGATGLVGSHAAERLRRAGHEVTALVRQLDGAGTSFLEGLGTRLVVGDITGASTELAERMAGCDAVVHSAAVVYRSASWQLYHEINVEAVERVLRAAAAAGARRVVHISSVAVYGGGSGPITEEQWQQRPIPFHALYARSKRDAEQVAWRLHADGEVRLTALRPVVVYGERDRLVTPKLARVVGWPIVPLPGGGVSGLPVTYAGNVADAVLAALERTSSIGRAYNLVEERPTTARLMVDVFAATLGRRPRIVSLPGSLVLGAARLGDAVARVAPGLSGAELRRGARLLLRGVPYDGSRARRELGWTGSVEPEEALARTAGWWRDVAARNPAAGE